MTLAVTRSLQADSDLVELYRYFADEAGHTLGDRFFDEVETATSRLARYPNIGSTFDRPGDLPLRVWRLTGFPRVLVLYSVRPPALLVERVVDGGRIIERGALPP